MKERRKRLAALFAAFCLVLMLLPVPAVRAEDGNGYTYIAPTLSKSADPYDPEKPEELSADQLYAKAAILIEATTGDVIFEKNADQTMYPASTTKILTTLLGVMMGDLSQEVTMTESAAQVEEGSSTTGLQVGETINFLDLLYATMIRSGNDGAQLIAELISGNEAEFANLMNEAAAMYGCTGTHFANASGLHDPNHYTTARDMAKIAQAAMQNDTFRQIAKTFSYTLPSSNVRKERTITGTNENWINPNQATKDDPEGVNSTYYPDAIGIKTGYTAAAGYCYVGAAERDGVELISVLFYTSKSGRWSDSKKLMEYGFSQFVSMTPLELYNENPITVETSGFSLDDADLGRLPLEVRAQASTRTVNIIGTKSDLEAMARNLSQTVLIEYTRDFSAPIEKGEVMGTMTYYPTDGGSPVVYDLIAGRTIQRRDNAPLTLEEIEAEVKADPNPLPPLSVELTLVVLTPFAVIFLIIHLVRRALHKTGRHKKSRVPRPRNRYFR